MVSNAPTTLQQLMLRSVEQYPQNNAVSFVGEVPLTYRQTYSKICEVAETLLSYGIKAGDKVAILSSNSPNWVISYFAIIEIGAVTVPLLPDFSSLEVDNILQHSESKAIFVSEKLRIKADESCSTFLETKIAIETLDVYNTSIESKVEQSVYSYKVKPEELASIIYTSGTTGKSKGVMLSHSNLTTQLEQACVLQPITDKNVFLSILPLSHTYENSLGMLYPLMRGASVYYLQKPPTAAVLMPALQSVKPTHLFSVPLIVEKLFKSKLLPEFQKTPLTRRLYGIPFFRKLMHRKAAAKLYQAFGGKLEFFGIGGAKLDPTVERFLYEGKAMPYAIGYGLTETAPLIAAATPKNVKPESTGFPLQGVEMRINDPNPETGEGEIWVKAGNVMQGYYKEDEMTSEVLTKDGWFKTGDLGVLVGKERRLYIKGRLKNLILSASGENIYPEDIEAVINNFKYVNESLVLEEKGKLMAMVLFNMEELETQYKDFKNNLEQLLKNLNEELQAYVNARVSRFSQISMVIAVSTEFEKTSTQKIKRYLYTSGVNHVQVLCGR